MAVRCTSVLGLFINALKENTMGMKVGGSSAGWSSYQTSSVNGWQQRQQGMKSLFSSLKAGDLAAAQQAFAGLQGNASTGNSALTKIGDALQAGDLAGAQQAAQAMHAARGGHHHAHAATQAADNSAPATNAANTKASSSDTSTAFNSFIQNLEAALEQQGKTTTDANGQGNFFFRMPPPPADLTNAANTSAPAATASTQAFLSGRDNTSVQASNAQLEASLESLIQQMNGTPGVSAATTSAASSSTASTNSNLQTSFANLVGAMGGQSATASVTDFMQTLDNRLKAMDVMGSGANPTA
jgi:hypothetical protein